MTRKEVITGTLKDFFGVDVSDEELSSGFLGVTLDDEDIEILSDALDQALGKNDENKNQ